MIKQSWELKNRFINLQHKKGLKQQSNNYVIYTFNHDLLGEEVMLMSFPNRTMIEGYNLNGIDYIAEPVVIQETTEISEFILTNAGYCTTSLVSLADLSVNTRWRAKQALSENDYMVIAMNLGEEYALQPTTIAEISQMGGLLDYGNNEYGISQELIDLSQQEGNNFNLGIFFAESTWDGFTIPTIDTEVTYVKTSGGILNIFYCPTSNTSELTVYCTDSFDSLGYCNPHIVRKIDGSGCNSVISIEDLAFDSYIRLTNIIIPNSVTSIGIAAFINCTGLTSVIIGNGVKSIENAMFYNCTGLTGIEIPNSVTSIGYEAFYQCSGLTSITIGNSVTSIGNRAFSMCSGLTDIEIPNSVTSIGIAAFSNCSSLINIKLSNNLNFILERTFSGCTKLNIIIPNSVTSIGDYAFESCTSLKDLKIEDANKVLSLGLKVFANCALETLYLGRDLSYQLLHNDSSPFYNKETLKSVTIGNNVTEIGNCMFYSCTGLPSITIPNSVTNIGDFAFAFCVFTSIIIPNSVTSLGKCVFCLSKTLKELTCLAENAPVLQADTFYEVPTTGTLKIPKGSDYSSWLEELGSGWTIEEIETL